METHGPFAPALEELCRVLPVISARDGIYGILGNHDCVEMIEPLGKLGVKFLVNDAVAINRNGEEVWLVGVDDPHFFMCHDLGQAFEDVPAAAFAILPPIPTKSTARLPNITRNSIFAATRTRARSNSPSSARFLPTAPRLGASATGSGTMGT